MQKKLAVLCTLLWLLGGTSLAQAVNLYDAVNNASTFKTFLSAVKIAGLTQKLKTDGPYTVFAPSDSAFSNLPEGQWEHLLENKARLVQVLSYHLMPGKVKVSEVKPGEAVSAEGSLLQLKSDNGMVTVNGARVTESDIAADNGVIHAIDKVLIPPD
jgi:uncharacterized surface protein with fasciclin (FAS1) repeats